MLLAAERLVGISGTI